MREQLIRYLLGELDDDELVELRARLKESPELQQELAHLRSCFDANRLEAEFEAEPESEINDEPLPSRSLAERTAHRIANSDEYELEQICAGKQQMSSSGDPPAGVLGWSLADLSVAGGVMLALSMLLFPKIRDSRDDNRLVVCQNNQVQLLRASSNYAEYHGGRYPQVMPNETVGMYAARLVREGYIHPEELAVIVVCPSSQVADEIRAGRRTIKFPSREQVRNMTRDEAQLAFASASPSYGYRMPCWTGNEYQDPFHTQTERPKFDPVFGDIAESAHRGGLIQFIGRNGAITSFPQGKLPEYLTDDELYLNKLGVVAAAIGSDDIVLATGDAVPGLETAHERFSHLRITPKADVPNALSSSPRVATP
jgi:hypothetical protein